MIVFEAPVTLGRFSIFEVLKYLFSGRTRIKIHKNDLIVIKPVSLIPARFVKASRLLKKLHLASMKAYVDRYADRDAVRVLMLFKAYQHFYVNEFKEHVSTIDYNDKFDMYPGHPEDKQAAARKREAAVLKEVDIVFATAYMLKKAAKRCNKNTHWLPNCIESNFTKKLYEPADTKPIKGPIIGHVGNINAWLDFKLINFLAKKNPDFSFVFIGDTSATSEAFKASEGFQASLKIPNIYYLGRKEYSNLYSYMMTFDICCIYYVPDEFKKHAHPNKFYMYLATGKPIVTTDFLPEARKLFGKFISIAKNNEEFENCIKKGLEENDAELRNRRVDFAKANDNVSRVARRFNIIKDFVDGRSID